MEEFIIRSILTDDYHHDFELGVEVLEDLYVDGLILQAKIEEELEVVQTVFMKHHVMDDLNILKHNLFVIECKLNLLTLKDFQLN